MSELYSKQFAVQKFEQLKEEMEDLIQFQQILKEKWFNSSDDENIITNMLLTPKIKGKFLQDKLLFTEFLHSIRRFLDTHPDSFLFIEKILFHIIDEIRSTFLSNEVYSIFFWNRNIILFFYENGCITLESLKQYSDFFKFYYFYPEFFEADFEFFDKKKKLYENVLKQFSNSNYRYETDENSLNAFRIKRAMNHSDEKIKQIIRNDDIESFMKFISSSNLDLNTKLKKSAFESNYLLFYEPTLFEYAAFFQSLKIFRFIYIQNCEITENLAKYAIAGGNYDIIHLLEAKKVVFDEECFVTAISYHHDDIIEYLIENYDLLNQVSIEKLINVCIQSYNFDFLFNLFENKSEIFLNQIENGFILNEACQSGVFHLVKFVLSFPNININKINEKTGVFNSFLFFLCATSLCCDWRK